MAQPLPQPGIRNKARGRAHPCRIGSGKSSPHQPFPLLPLAMGTGQDSGLLGPQFPYLHPQSGDSDSGLDLLCRPAVEELGTWSKALDSLAWLPGAGAGAGGGEHAAALLQPLPGPSVAVWSLRPHTIPTHPFPAQHQLSAQSPVGTVSPFRPLPRSTLPGAASAQLGADRSSGQVRVEAELV